MKLWSSERKHPIGLYLTFVVLLMFGGCYGCMNAVYSDGYRDGVVRKFSTRGIIFKTHEGELGLDGVAKSVWEFAVTDPEIIKQLEAVPAGQIIRLHYKQYYFSTPWIGNAYIVNKVENIKK